MVLQGGHGMTNLCPLCISEDTHWYYENKQREFYHCRHCDLVFVPSHFHLPAREEKKLYDFHQNSIDDPGYCDFLNTLVMPLIQRLAPGMRGLDYGAGPGPTLSQLLQRQGFAMQIYDPLYCDDAAVLQLQYDFVTCTEVVEHFSKPALDWLALSALVKPEGLLALMTLLRNNQVDFASWWYKNDMTHVAFYSPNTIEWLAAHYGFELIYADARRVLILQKSVILSEAVRSLVD